ncbi:MAG TPA: cytochrome b/b6 domain-containing protein [Steroidobacteraceae bacterium]|nr:cytochrome b/b6 domain-containing protein [Steroidobacteraceae bacterium]
MAAEVDSRGRLVWDLPVRITHWLLAICVPLAWLTHELGTEYFRWHVYTGYTVAVLVVFRFVWGFMGTRHARFTRFVRGPAAVVRYLRSRGRDGSAGHNPAGGWMVLVMLGLLALQAGTGLFANDQIFNTGPFYGWISPELSDALSRLHRRSFDWLLIAIALHIVAVLAYLAFGKRNLVWPMLTGRKPAHEVSERDAIDGSRLGWAIVVVAATAGTLAVAVRLAPDAGIALSF